MCTFWRWHPLADLVLFILCLATRPAIELVVPLLFQVNIWALACPFSILELQFFSLRSGSYPLFFASKASVGGSIQYPLTIALVKRSCLMHHGKRLCLMHRELRTLWSARGWAHPTISKRRTRYPWSFDPTRVQHVFSAFVLAISVHRRLAMPRPILPGTTTRIAMTVRQLHCDEWGKARHLKLINSGKSTQCKKLILQYLSPMEIQISCARCRRLPPWL